MKARISPELKKILTRNKTPVQLRQRVKANEHNSTLKADENRREAYRKYLEEGKSKSVIAREMNVTPATVIGWLNHEYEQTKMANSHSAGVVREQISEQLDQLIGRFMPLALHEGLQVKGEKYGRNGELEYITIETWDAGKSAADIVLKALDRKAKIFGLEKVAIELPKGGNILLANNLFMAVRNAVDKSDFTDKTETLDAEFSIEPKQLQ